MYKSEKSAKLSNLRQNNLVNVIFISSMNSKLKFLKTNFKQDFILLDFISNFPSEILIYCLIFVQF